MRNACEIPKATNTHSEYVIIIAFPLQQWLRERASVLRYTYVRTLPVLFYVMDVKNVVSITFQNCLPTTLLKPQSALR